MRKKEAPGCSCRQCKRGRHNEWGKTVIKRTIRRLRQKYRLMLKSGDGEQVVVSTPYTD